MEKNKLDVPTYCNKTESDAVDLYVSSKRDEKNNIILWMTHVKSKIHIFVNTASNITSLALKIISPLNLIATFSIDLPNTPIIYIKINKCVVKNSHLLSFEFYFGDTSPSNDYKKMSCQNEFCNPCYFNKIHFSKCFYLYSANSYSASISLSTFKPKSTTKLTTKTITSQKTTSIYSIEKKQLLSSTSVNSFASNADIFKKNYTATTFTKSVSITDSKQNETILQNESPKWNKSLGFFSVCLPIRLVDCVKCYMKKKCLYRNPYCIYTAHSKPHESFTITENESFIINLKPDAKINLNFYIRTNTSSEFLVYVSSPRNLTLFFNIIPTYSNYIVSFSEIFYVEYLDGSFSSVYSFLINTDNKNFVNYEPILCVDYKICRFSSTNNTHLQINHTNLFLSNVEHNETINNNNNNNIYLQFQDVNFTILYGINSDSPTNGFSLNLTKLTKLTNILLLSGILSIVFVFIVISTILFYCKVVKPKRKLESPNNPQLTETITPELSIPELSIPELSIPELSIPELSIPEVLSLEVVAQEIVAPEIITTEEEAHKEGEEELLEIKEKPPITVIVLNIDSSKIDQKVLNINIEMKQ
jgi:hypothetical protein